MKSLVLSILVTFIGLPLVADELSIDRSYSYQQPDFFNKDTACISAFKNVIASGFRGLNGIELSAHSITDTSFGALATYTDVRFRSIYGDSVGLLVVHSQRVRVLLPMLAWSSWELGLVVLRGVAYQAHQRTLRIGKSAAFPPKYSHETLLNMLGIYFGWHPSAFLKRRSLSRCLMANIRKLAVKSN